MVVSTLHLDKWQYKSNIDIPSNTIRFLPNAIINLTYRNRGVMNNAIWLF